MNDTLFASMAGHLILRLLYLAGLVSALTPGDIQSYLKSQLSADSEVLVSSDQSYNTTIKQRWNAYDAPSFVVGVKPATAQDVATIVRPKISLAHDRYSTDDRTKVRYASSHSIPFLGTGGGHGYSTTTDALKSGINIDLGSFKSVSIDSAASKMTIGGAVTFGEVLDPVYKAGKEIRESLFHKSIV